MGKFGIKRPYFEGKIFFRGKGGEICIFLSFKISDIKNTLLQKTIAGEKFTASHCIVCS